MEAQCVLGTVGTQILKYNSYQLHASKRKYVFNITHIPWKYITYKIFITNVLHDDCICY